MRVSGPSDRVGVTSNVAGGAIFTDDVDVFTNEGTVEAKNGGFVRMVNVAPHAGTISIGVGSTVAVTGNLSQQSAGVINVEIGGTSASQFGRLSVTGTATLDGTLNVTLDSTRWGMTEVFAAAIVDAQSNAKVSETSSTTLDGRP